MWSGLKLFVIALGGFKAASELIWAWKLARLGVALLPLGFGEQEGLCDLCDAMIADKLLKGAKGMRSLPCPLLCLRVSRCVHMCETVKTLSQNATAYPCAAAGYCADHPDADGVECASAPGFRCAPSAHCERRWKPWGQGGGFTCQMRPGLSRWIGMRNSVHRHSAAVVSALWAQPRCGESGRGEWCIAEPRGVGAVAELVGIGVSILYGGLHSIQALETPGGDDDRQWLTFWMIMICFSAAERWARVLLSWCPRYYEVKLLLLLWLLRYNGADRLYRVLRRWLKGIVRSAGLTKRLLWAGAAEATAAAELKERVPPSLEAAAMAAHAAAGGRLPQPGSGSRTSATRGGGLFSSFFKRSAAGPNLPVLDETAAAPSQPATGGKMAGGEDDDGKDDREVATAGKVDGGEDHNGKDDRDSQSMPAPPRSLQRMQTIEGVMHSLESRLRGAPSSAEERLIITYRWLLTTEGSAALAHASLTTAKRAALLERAADYVCFNPRFLQLHLLGVPPGADAEIPPCDGPGRADVYLVCYLVDSVGQRYPHEGVASRVCYRTTSPSWRQSLELQLRGGVVTPQGYYRNEQAGETGLQVEAINANVGFWGWAFYLSELFGGAIAVSLVVGHVGGAFDNLSERQLDLAYTGASVFIAAFLCCLVLHFRFRADDTVIGVTDVLPLRDLLDRSVHEFKLPLRDPVSVYGADDILREDGDDSADAPRKPAFRNAAGKLGTVHIACAYAET